MEKKKQETNTYTQSIIPKVQKQNDIHIHIGAQGQI